MQGDAAFRQHSLTTCCRRNNVDEADVMCTEWHAGDSVPQMQGDAAFRQHSLTTCRSCRNTVDEAGVMCTEWHAGDSVPHILSDFDAAAGRSTNGYVASPHCLNTLRCYGLSDGAIVSLTSRPTTVSTTTSFIYADSLSRRLPIPRTVSRHTGNQFHSPSPDTQVTALLLHYWLVARGPITVTNIVFIDSQQALSGGGSVAEWLA